MTPAELEVRNIMARMARDAAEQRRDRKHHAQARVEPTLGDRIPADGRKLIIIAREEPCQFCGLPVSAYGHTWEGKRVHGSCLVESGRKEFTK